jgi:hypothetical protein
MDHDAVEDPRLSVLTGAGGGYGVMRVPASRASLTLDQRKKGRSSELRSNKWMIDPIDADRRALTEPIEAVRE